MHLAGWPVLLAWFYLVLNVAFVAMIVFNKYVTLVNILDNLHFKQHKVTFRQESTILCAEDKGIAC